MIISLGVLEYLWFFHVIGDFFNKEISHLLASDPKIAVAVLFYIFYPISLIILVHSRVRSSRAALLLGAFVGFTVYFIYDLTNYVTLFEWSLNLMMVDIAWGTIVTGIVSLIGFKFLKRDEN